MVLNAATSWAVIGTSPYSSRKAALPKTWSTCSWVFTSPTTGRAESRRRSAMTSWAAFVEALVSTTSRPASPSITVTLTSYHS